VVLGAEREEAKVAEGKVAAATGVAATEAERAEVMWAVEERAAVP